MLVLLFTGIKGQVFSPMQVISETPDNPLVVISADLNNDGYDDVIYSSTGDNEISCNLFDPAAGIFGDTVLLGTQFHLCTSLFPSDLDNDGLIDILAVSQINDNVGWYKNNGDGNFSIQQYINDDAPHAASVTAADVDNDGDMDVMSAQKGDNTILLYLNDGNGNFSTPEIITSSAEIPVVVTTGDLNNDSFPDIIAGYGQTDKIVLFMNNGDGTFQDGVIITSQADFITNITTADIDMDGDADIISTSKNDNKLAWYRNLDGTGTFSEQIVISQNLSAVYGLTVADFDLDGDMDIVTSSPNDDLILLFKNENQDFQPMVISSEIQDPKGLAAGDFNGDGLIDIAAADAWEAGYTNKIDWFENGKSCFVVHNINKSISSWQLAMTDYNQDGNIDIFYSDGQSVRRVDNQGAGGSFSEEHILFDQGYNIWDLKFADANNDGYDDLFVADAMGDHIFWLENLGGTGEFSGPNDIDTQCNEPASMDLSDIDGDNNIDLVVALVNENKIALYLNTQGNGNFTKTIVADTLNSPMSLCFSDYDNDGDDDIFYSGYTFIGYLINDGTGSFSGGGIAAPTVSYSDELSSADLNNDGYDDIVCNPGYATWLINNQDGTFTKHEIETWGGSYGIATGDLNNDNYTDIISAAGNVNRAYYLKNINGGEDFENKSYAVEQEIREVLTGDINNDGYDDITLGCWPAENLSWAENFMFRIINNPHNDTVCDGETATFSVLTAGVSAFQWQMDDGTGWTDIVDNNVFSGAGKALLTIVDVTENIFGNQFRCSVQDEQGDIHFTQAAQLFKRNASAYCVGNQVRTANSSGIYTVTGNEFDPDTILNPCNEPVTLTNDYNNLETLDGEMFEVGNYSIVWTLTNQQNEIVDNCSFEVEIDAYTNIPQPDKDRVAIYPNPFRNFVIINNPNADTPVEVEISDIRGRKILQRTFLSQKYKIDLGKLPKGIYAVKIKSKRNVYVEKIVKR